MADKKVVKMGNAKKMSHEQIVAGFNQLRQDQRALVSKIAELDSDQNEHRLVLETLQEVDGERKCFRLVGGVLVERTVKDVLPALTHNKEQIEQLTKGLTKQMESKGREINEYREKHNLKVRGEQPADQAPTEKADSSGSAGVLVSQET
ncbi:prefoldin subunit 2 [Strongylocentrotus purpuratus]|uniref:Prefoldin subunit 2 n=1 Tax=Strongylocentrotus purpuratus TaxID=7668 RepID=A0A7M7TH13_STRPU|nr:prefoldin subunit 2-like [Strongylocentrotus purpuratus]XP_794448.2 prefoldin subunit 2 [Strongylocentrotus purpuratus]|eukprot:XP_794448.2 PREDICTED: prefoldin subunit 2 [Strongylocentrotus purpuratus]